MKRLRRVTANNPLADTVRFLLPKAKKLAGFFLGQGSVQALNLLTGFLLLRWLGVEQYAIYTLLAGFQATMGVLVEMGLGNSLVGLLAGRTDKATLGGYIRSANHYRNLFFLIAAPVMAAAFLWLFLRQGWAWELGLVLMLALLANTFFLSWNNYYSMPFLIRHDMSGLYWLQTVFAALRLGVCWALHLGGAISTAAVAWITALATTAVGLARRKQAAPFLEEPKNPDPEKNQEALKLIRPMIPATLFFAFQGQISIYLISFFGRQESIAEVGALGRISQIFVMLGAFNGVFIAPQIAKTARALLARKYLLIFFAASALCVLGTLGAFVAPQYLVWLLGEKYLDLSPLMGWLILSSSLAYLTNVLFSMHSARKWIFSWGVWAYILSVLVSQCIMLCFMNLSTTYSVVLFGIYSNAASFIVQVVWGFYAFAREPSTHGSP